MDPISRVVAAGAAGAGGAAGAALYVDDVFSTYLYEGNSSTRTITNGIDLSGEGGLTWIKCRTISDLHYWYDTKRGATKSLHSNGTYNEGTRSNTLTSFNSNGFSLGTDGDTNFSGRDYVSWTFRKAPGFFDVVTYTGTGTSGLTVNHSLGSVPGCIAVKRTDSTGAWRVFHRSLGATKHVELDGTGAVATNTAIFNDTAPTSTQFTLGNNSSVNASGGSYVAYLWAHDDQSFGTDSNEAIIKCGSVTTGSDEYATVDLGFEPQFVMFKRTDTSGDWLTLDTMRGWDLGNDDKRLYANLTQAENTTSSGHGEVNSTGFRIYNLGGSADLIYIAIRRPHKPPEAGTDVFASQTTTPEQTSWTPGFAPDALFTTRHLATSDKRIGARLMGPQKTLLTQNTSTESTGTDYFHWDEPTGTIRQTYYQSSDGTGLHYAFKRAPGFFDVVCGTGFNHVSAVTHNLGAQPQLIIAKQRNRIYEWLGAANIGGSTGNISLNTADDSYTGHSGNWNTHVTSTTFDPGFVLRRHNGGISSSTTDTYVVYLFGTLSGISKVGNYSGTGNNVDVDCGFAAGARFVLIKRTDSDGDWYVWDSTRGIVSGDDPYLLFNSMAAHVTDTDYVDPLDAGFTVTSSAPAALNTSGGTYLFLAIA